MKNWGIKNRIMLVAFLPAISISLLLGVLYTLNSAHEGHRLLKQKSLTITNQAKQLATSASSSKHTQILLKSLLRSALQDQDVRSISILSDKGDIMLHAGPQSYTAYQVNQFADGAEVPVEGSQNLLFIAELPFTAGKNSEIAPPAWVVVETNLSRLRLEYYQKILTSTIVAGLGLAISLFFALRASRDLVTPIGQITQVLSDLKEGKLESRLFIEASHEMKELASGVNALAGSLNNAYEEMQQNVDQATEDLRQTLETIEIQNIELDIARKEALEASRVKSEFLANMSHEIRTPLNGILGFTNLLLKGHLSHTQRDHLLTIKKSSEILLTIINDILDFSKIEAGKLQLDRIPLKLKETLEDVLTMLAPSAHQKGLELVAIVYDDVPNNVFGDPLRIKQIITNLVSNAVKFTQSGEIIVRAMIEDLQNSKALIKITVTDTGVGLSRIQQESLFHAFSQADASTARQYGGTGLGLVISRRLIEEMGGQIGVESELGKGSTFWVKLPCDIVKNALEEEPSLALASERVIYYEPHQPSRLSVTHMLESWKLQVSTVDSLKQMLDQISTAQVEHKGYALAIIGAGKLELNSAQLKSVVRELEYNRDCRTMLLTPTIDETNHPVLEFVSARLVKPAPHQRLYDSIATLVLGQTREEAQEKQPETYVQSATQHAKKPLVLAVDDNDANLKLVKAFLEEMNVHIHTATSGFEALSKAKQHQYDLMFMDVQMPGMDGIETTQKIRQLDHQKGTQTPIVALTAHALTEEKQKLLSSGFDDYITKPISEAQLQDVIQRKTGYQPIGKRRTYSVTNVREIKPSTRSMSGPCVDIGASIELSAGKADLAEELFNMLLEHLIDDYEAIQEHFENDDRDQLMHRVHKLHGATKYCGVPELRQYAEIFETALKQDKDPLYPDFKNLMSAINRVQMWAEHNDWQEMFKQHSLS